MKFSLFLTERNLQVEPTNNSRNMVCKKLVEEAAVAVCAIQTWPRYAATPLRNLPGLAKRMNVGAIAVKDEAERFGLGSFKALGGAYAISRLLTRRLKDSQGIEVGLDYLVGEEGRGQNSAVTVCCATDGNHGRSVAWGAQMFGCQCVIYIHKTVSEERKQAIESLGARVVRTAGNYDDSVREIQKAAQKEGWEVVSDTSYEGYMDIPLDVMAGYSIMATEAVSQWHEALGPTHVFLQTGVGSMAAAVVVQLQQAYGKNYPKIILVDPENAACWYDSLKAGTPKTVGGDHDTIMAGLACGEVSQLAWTLLARDVEGVIVIDDDAAEETMRLLATGNDLDLPLVAGESGVGGLVGFVALADDDPVRDSLGIDAHSRLLFFSTEGATDKDTYQKIVGKTLEEITKGG